MNRLFRKILERIFDRLTTVMADRLGYRLVGGNRFGFNAFYLRKDLGRDLIPDTEVNDLFRHSRNRERMKLFETVKDFEFVSV